MGAPAYPPPLVDDGLPLFSKAAMLRSSSSDGDASDASPRRRRGRAPPPRPRKARFAAPPRRASSWRRRLLVTAATLAGVAVAALWVAPLALLRPPHVALLSDAAVPADPPLVPRVIHQTWRDAASIPPAFAAARAACAAAHPGWSHHLWTDADARALLASRFPAALRAYDRYPHPVQRADIARYAILAVHGGVYLDMDVACERALDPLLTAPLTLPLTWPAGVSNDVMAAAPGNHFMASLVARAPRVAWLNAVLPRYAAVMFSTGPMYVTLSLMTWASRAVDVHLLPPRLYGKYGPRGARLHGAGAQGGALVTHLHASSWHGHDAAAVAWVGRHGAAALGGAGVVVATAAAVVVTRRAAAARRTSRRAPSPVKLC